MVDRLTAILPTSVKRALRRRYPLAASAWHYARRSSALTGLSPLRHFREEMALHRSCGVGPRSYYFNRLYDPALPMAAKTTYLPDDLHDGGPETIRFACRLTPKRHRQLYLNKLVSYHFLSSFGLPLARVYGVFDPAVGSTADSLPLRTAAELQRWLDDFSGDGFVFKPMEGCLGFDVLVLTGRAEGDPRSFVALDGERYDAERLEAFARDSSPRLKKRTQQEIPPYLLQERLHSHPDVRALVGGPTVSSARLVTFVSLDGRPRLLAASFKLQPGLVGADNFARGSVACSIDLETGALGPGRKKEVLEEVTTIPGTDRRFVGFRLPDWENVKELAIRAASTFPWARAVGWDIALCDRGPVLLEGNDHWDPSLVQYPAAKGLMTGEFKTLYDTLA